MAKILIPYNESVGCTFVVVEGAWLSDKELTVHSVELAIVCFDKTSAEQILGELAEIVPADHLREFREVLNSIDWNPDKLGVPPLKLKGDHHARWAWELLYLNHRRNVTDGKPPTTPKPAHC